MKSQPHFVVLLTFLLFASVGSTVQAERPNILFAIADDWSYGHASAYGSEWVQTPSFDRLAREGFVV